MTDRFTVRTVVVGLTVGVLFGLAAMAYLAFTGTAIPDQLDRLITFLAGALTSVLVKTSHDGPTEVQVVNEPKDAVPVNADAAEPTKARR